MIYCYPEPKMTFTENGLYMSYRFEKFYGDEWIPIPADAVRQMDRAGETDLKILLAAAERLSRGPAEEEELIALLSADFTPEAVSSALAFWRGAGILANDRKKAAKKAAPAPEKEPEEAPEKKPMLEHPPYYAPDELARAKEEQPAFQELLKFTEDTYGAFLKRHETEKLYSFLDYYKLSKEAVMLIIGDLAGKDKKSLYYVEKVVKAFADNGFDTYEKADAELARRRRFDEYAKVVRGLFGFGERALTAKEKEAIDAWQKWGFAEDMLTAAYEKTVAAAKKPSVAYMHKILEDWHNNGWQTPADVEKGRIEADHPAKTYDLDDFFEAAVAKSMKTDEDDPK